MLDNRTLYEKNVQDRSLLRYFIGLIVRWKQNFKYARARRSHNIDSPDWNLKNYGITIEDYVWIPTNVLILPSCRNISYGSVIGSGSVVVKNTDPMSVVGGNPAKELKKRKCVHSNLIVESLLGGDYDIYKKTRKKRHC